MENVDERKQNVLKKNFLGDLFDYSESGDFFVNACVLCDLNEKPTSDYDYEGMQQARKGVRNCLRKRKNYTSLILK